MTPAAATQSELTRTEADQLAHDLQSSVSGEVRFDPGARAMYSTDASNYRQLPIGVVLPRSVDDVIAAVAVCRRRGVPILSRGGGTSLAGQTCNVAVVIDWSRHLNRVLEIDPDGRRARVEPGCVLDTLRDAAEQYHLTFGPDPATHTHNTLGGMIGNDSCGVHSVLAARDGGGARTADNLEAMDILTYDGLRMTVGPTSDADYEAIVAQGGRRGEIYQKLRALRDRYADQIRARFPGIPRRVSGFNITELLPERGFNVARALVGSEGTCVTVLEATVALIHSPPCRTLVVLGYPDLFQAGDAVPEIMSHRPTALEGIDELLIEFMRKKNMHPENVKMLPEGCGWLLVEFGGETVDESRGYAQGMMDALRRGSNPPAMKLFDNKEEEQQLWKVRESGLGATTNIPGEHLTWPGWEDSAVAPEKVGDYLRDFRKLFDRYEYRPSIYGHFGQGCIHCSIPFDLRSAEGIAKFRRFLDDAADLVVRFGGSFSGEHGDGQARGELLPKMFGPELMEAFREFKTIWDPTWKMNPGKVVDPFPITSNLRLGADYHPLDPDTHFAFPDDKGRFAEAALRCVGVGNCRRHEGGVMCPSYMATREEEHSTRGRARMLFEMLQGEAITKGWKSDQVFNALDLCLSCKGCKGDCPVNVDMATYKAEFLSHYYEGKLRPRHAFAFGHIDRWARLASHMPRLVNAVGRTPIVRSVAKFAAGMAPQRNIPAFATQTFRQWHAQRGTASRHDSSDGRRVILWADTFNNHFHPNTAKSAVAVLEAAGFAVTVPAGPLCCGRPLYDFGYLDDAKRYLERILAALSDEIARKTPMVVLEPSCASVFRDELINLVPHPAAKQLSKQTMLLSEFLQANAPDWQPPRLERDALVHGHCHHKAVMKMTAEHSVLDRLGLRWSAPDQGCCGMAGAFGFEPGRHYDVAIKCGERALIPAVRKASADTLLIADGFSCREQISQMTGREAIHLADVLQLAMHQKDVPSNESNSTTRRERSPGETAGV